MRQLPALACRNKPLQLTSHSPLFLLLVDYAIATWAVQAGTAALWLGAERLIRWADRACGARWRARGRSHLSVKLEIPGQLGGPECRQLVKVAVALRRLLEPAVSRVPSPPDKLVLLLRVSGTLQEFGGDGALPPVFEDEAVVCEIEIKPRSWADLGPRELREILIPYLLEGIERCVQDRFLPRSLLDEAKHLLAS